MKKAVSFVCLVLISTGAFFSCQDSHDPTSLTVPSEVNAQLVALGFNVVDQVPIRFDEGYLVEGDIYLTPADLASMKQADRVPVAEQYSTNQLVTGTPRVIKVYMPTTFSAANFAAV